MRHESLYLTDIVEAADHIAEFIAGIDLQAFQKSELLRSAVAQKLAIIGEAAARISEDFKTRHSQVPWPQIVAFRNILVPRILRDRLGRGVAGCQESLPRFARAGSGNPRSRIRWPRGCWLVMSVRASRRLASVESCSVGAPSEPLRPAGRRGMRSGRLW